MEMNYLCSCRAATEVCVIEMQARQEQKCVEKRG